MDLKNKSEEMNKKLKIAAFIVAMVLIVGVGWFANELVGNPISKMLATNAAERHLEAEYADKDFYIDRVTYSFKDCNYYAYVKSQSSVDSEFTLCISGGGKLKWDSYEDRVVKGWNTANRLSTEYREVVDSVLESPTFPFGHDIGFGELQCISREYAHTEGIPEYALITEDLVLDKVYNIAELGKEAGHLVLYVQDEAVTVERAAEVLLELKYLMDEAGVPFYAIDFVLEYPRNEDGTWREGRIETQDFLSKDIYEEGMVERVNAANEAAIAYHAGEDAEKADLMEKLQGQ